MTGYNWTADEMVFHHKPEEYGAIHFHDDDIDDARWDLDLLTKYRLIRSGVYAARLRINGEGQQKLRILYHLQSNRQKAKQLLIFFLFYQIVTSLT